jgi:proteasome assembly chaperone (PAC2) family protein
MKEDYTLLKKPEADEVYMIAGWRQWADAGSVSSGLPLYLIQQTKAAQIGQINPDGFYIFQVPGTHDLMRPLVRFKQGYPEFLETRQNELFYTGDKQRGVVIFIGDEPHLDVERYIAALLDVAQALRVKRIIGLGGIYGEVPYDKDRIVTSNFSKPELKAELENLSVTLSDYQGGASIGSFLCRRAGDRGIEYVGLYAFVPHYDFSDDSQPDSAIRIENDTIAWLGVMRRINYMLKTGFDLSDLEKKNRLLVEEIESKINDLEKNKPQLGVRAYLQQLSDNFNEVPFSPLDDVWEKNIGQLLNEFDGDEDTDEIPDE